MLRIDTHHHMIPPDYRNALRKARNRRSRRTCRTRLERGRGRCRRWPNSTWPPPSFRCPPRARPSCRTRADAAALARDVNDYSADLVASQPDRFGFFATVPMPHIDESVAETVRALDELKADGVVLLANNDGVYLGQEGQDDLFAVLDQRSAVVFIHPAELPGPDGARCRAVGHRLPLDTTRAAYLLVRNGIRRKYPNIRFILSHAGGFVPYASHRMAVAITGDTGRSPADILDDFSELLLRHRAVVERRRAADAARLREAGAHHLRVRLPVRTLGRGKAVRRWAGDLRGDLDAAMREAIDRTNALALFPRLGTAPAPARPSRIDTARHIASRMVMRGVARLISTS